MSRLERRDRRGAASSSPRSSPHGRLAAVSTPCASASSPTRSSSTRSTRPTTPRRTRTPRRSPSRSRSSSSGMEPVMQLVCRDRNRLALEAEHRRRRAARDREHLLPDRRRRHGRRRARGAPRVRPRLGPARSALARTLAPGKYLSGRPLEPAPNLFLGAVENPGAPPHDYRVERASKKVARRRPLPAAADRLRPASPLARLHGGGRATAGSPSGFALIPSICLLALAARRCASSTSTSRASASRRR